MQQMNTVWETEIVLSAQLIKSHIPMEEDALHQIAEVLQLTKMVHAVLVETMNTGIQDQQEEINVREEYAQPDNEFWEMVLANHALNSNTSQITNWIALTALVITEKEEKSA